MKYYLTGEYFGKGCKIVKFEANIIPLSAKSLSFSGSIKDDQNENSSQLIEIKISKNEEEISFTRNFFDEKGLLRPIYFKLYKCNSTRKGKFWEGETIDGKKQLRVICNIKIEDSKNL